jgi:hypothetical protein
MVREGLGLLLNKIDNFLKLSRGRVRKQTSQEATLHVKITWYSSPYTGFEARSNIDAKKALSNYAYKEFFIRSMKRSSCLQHNDEPGGSVVVWAANYDITKENHTIIPSHGRCPCIRHDVCHPVQACVQCNQKV